MEATTQETIDIKKSMQRVGEKAREVSRILALASADQKESALHGAATSIRQAAKEIVAANNSDMKRAERAGLGEALIDRLRLTPDRTEAMAKGIEVISSLPDPVGRVLAQWERPNGLQIQRVSVPLGVIGIIYESRPNVTADAGALCLKSGNAAILRPGSDSFETSKAIVNCLHAGLASARLPEASIQLVPTNDRSIVGEMLLMSGYIDVIIPRGGKSLTKRVMEESKIPTLQHLDGNCHTYIHETADPQMAKEVLLNAKLRRTGICGATESVLIDVSIARTLLPALLEALISSGCEVRGDETVCAIDNRVIAASEGDWAAEYLDAVVSVKTV